MKKIKILIPVYNDWKSVFKLLENIDLQVSEWDAEVSIFIINDASTENQTKTNKKTFRPTGMDIRQFMRQRRLISALRAYPTVRFLSPASGGCGFVFSKFEADPPCTRYLYKKLKVEGNC